MKPSRESNTYQEKKRLPIITLSNIKPNISPRFIRTDMLNIFLKKEWPKESSIRPQSAKQCTPLNRKSNKYNMFNSRSNRCNRCNMFNNPSNKFHTCNSRYNIPRLFNSPWSQAKCIPSRSTMEAMEATESRNGKTRDHLPTLMFNPNSFLKNQKRKIDGER